jgi:hypothetical protein
MSQKLIPSELHGCYYWISEEYPENYSSGERSGQSLSCYCESLLHAFTLVYVIFKYLRLLNLNAAKSGNPSENQKPLPATLPSAVCPKNSAGFFV